ncbi:MAG: hypothetical protein H7329_18120 [Opitutaceae bacterium]|nr:hypothetical protein [Cytophagales bacterium]
MKILETILFALTVVFFIIGVHQTYHYGLLNSYFLFTFAVFTLLGYGFLKRNREEKASKEKK